MRASRPFLSAMMTLAPACNNHRKIPSRLAGSCILKAAVNAPSPSSLRMHMSIPGIIETGDNNVYKFVYR